MSDFQIEFNQHLAAVHSSDAPTGIRSPAAVRKPKRSPVSDADDAALRRSLETGILAIQQDLKKIQSELQMRTVEYSLEICRAVLQSDVELVQQRIESNVSSALAALETTGEIRVSVHPTQLDDLKTMADASEIPFTVQADETLLPGDCRVEHENRGLVANLDFQLQIIRQRLLESLSGDGGRK